MNVQPNELIDWAEQAETERTVNRIAEALRPIIVRAVQREFKKKHRQEQAALAAMREAGWDQLDGSLALAVGDVVAASTVLERDQYSRGEAAAQKRLDTALSHLRTEFRRTRVLKERNMQ